MIQVTKLSKKYDKSIKYAIEDINFCMNEGEMIGLIGKNGAGKSTLLKSMCKFIKPSDGDILFDKSSIFQDDNNLKDVGILLEPVFYPYLTAKENLEFYLNIHNKSNYKDEIKTILDMVGLGKNINDKPSSFSFGMKQRLGLAQALLGEPKLLLLDEPFVGLDPKGVVELIEILKERVKKYNIKAIISSHQLHELSEVCERVLVMNNGNLVFDGIPDLRPEISFVLDREYAKDQETEHTRIKNNVVTTNLTGENLHNFMERLMKQYKIVGVETIKSSLEHFFQEDSYGTINKS